MRPTGSAPPLPATGRARTSSGDPNIGNLDRPPQIEQARLALAQHRSRRPRPGLDDKVVTEWEGMATAALAYAGAAFNQPRWVEAAAETATVLLGRSRRPDGRWLRSRAPGRGDGPLACAADYAWMVEAFTRLGEATGRAAWAQAAAETTNELVRLFWDADGGGFHTSGADGQQLVARMKDVYDGACPSANATAARALARLGELTRCAPLHRPGAAHCRGPGPALQASAHGIPGPCRDRRLPGAPPTRGAGLVRRPGPRCARSGTGTCPTRSWRGARPTLRRCGRAGTGLRAPGELSFARTTPASCLS